MGKGGSERTTQEYKIQKNQSGAYLALLEEVLFVSKPKLCAGIEKSKQTNLNKYYHTEIVIYLNEGSGSKNIGHCIMQLCETIRK